MDYCSVQDVITNFDDKILIQLTDDENTGSIVESVIAESISNVTGEINGYIVKKYALPLPTIPGSLKTYSLDMVLYRLYGRRQGPLDWVSKQYDDAIKYLLSISNGDAHLDIEVSGVSTTIENPGRLFTRDKMVSF